MAQNVIIAGASYSGVPAIDVPKSGGGTARFIDPAEINSTLLATLDSDFVAENIKKDVDLFGLVGSFDGGGGGDGDIDAFIERKISGAYTNENVSLIGRYAFAACSSLTTISFPACMSISSYAFQYCSSLNDISFPVCLNIASYAFQSCNSLTAVSFPACTSIGATAFGSCKNLQTANFPVLRSVVNNSCFVDCIALTSVSFPLLTGIPCSFFNGCNSLSVASFPSCKDILNYAFAKCYNLLSLYLLSSIVPRLSNRNAFSSTPISDYTTSTGGVYGSIIVQASMLDAFKAATNWSLYSSRFSVWNGVD